MTWMLALLVLQHANVVDAGKLRRDVTIVVDGDRIASLGGALPERAQTVDARPAAQIVDASGLFVIPGLWDMHVHLSFAGQQSLLDLVASGVTGVRDMGGDVWQIEAWRREIAAGARIGPRIVQAGPLLDGPKPGVPHRITVQTADDARAAVRVLARGLHADFVKVHNGVPRDAFFAAADEAKRAGLPVACHLPSAITIEEASTAGCKSIEHLAESILSSLGKLDDLAGPRATAAFALFARNGTWVDPTLTAFTHFAATSDSKKRLDVRQAATEKFFAAVLAMRRAGVRLLAGSDMAGAFWPTDVHDELRLFVEAGIEPGDALAIATKGAADFLGLHDSGSIAPGQIADLVLLSDNPLADIRATRSIHGVVLRGRYFTAEQLQLLVVNARGH
jgi:imidazolonepropionase-like amidohydrolase